MMILKAVQPAKNGCPEIQLKCASMWMTPLCGQPFPNSFFVEMLALLNTIWLPLNEARIPKKLPVS